VYASSPRRWRFAQGVAALLVSLQLYGAGPEHVVYRGRSFFGAFRVLLDDNGRERLFVHGATVHGVQSLEPGRRAEPLAYFSRSGPIGQVFEEFSGRRRKSHVGIVGLGHRHARGVRRVTTAVDVLRDRSRDRAPGA